MSTVAWIDVAFRGARPQAMGALLRHFRDLDLAEEAFQEACLRALTSWPKNGPPRDTVAWLVFVGRNAALDGVRKRRKERELPDERAVSNLSDVEGPLAEQLDDADYRDDLLRLLFMCCHPELPGTQQIALALRIVCGLTIPEIARAFLVTDVAMEQRITRAKNRVAAEHLPFETPGAPERADRLAAVATVLYLLFNEGYSATGGSAHVRVPLCNEAIRLARLLLRLFPGEPEMLGLTALMLLQHSRSSARLDAQGAIVLLEDQDRSLWNPDRITEGLALLDKALRHARPGPYQVQAAIAALHARAPHFEDTDWAEIEQLYAALEELQPSPVVSLNRAIAVAKLRGPSVALAMLDVLAKDLPGYFYFFGVRGALLMELGRRDEAREAFDRALALAKSPAEATHIRSQIDRLTRKKDATE